MNNWPTVSIKECARVVGGSTPKSTVPEYWDGDVAWVTPKDLARLAGKFIDDTPRKITQKGLKSCSAEILPSYSVLFSSRAPIGHVAINTIPMATNQGFKSFVPGKSLDSSFLYWWLKAHRPQLEQLGNGATFKEVSKAVVERIEIPLPPLPEQRRIAAILDKADAIRRKRQRAIELTEDFLRSAFLEMFGDPVTNPRGWDRKPLGELGEIVTGNTPSRKNPEYYGTAIEWIKSDNINTPRHYLTEAEEYLSEEGKKVGRVAPAGSILVTCIAGTPECIGNVAIADREIAFNQQINALIPYESSAHLFLYAQFLVAKKLVQRASTESMKGLVSKGRFSSIEFVVPPINLQRQFCALFERYHSMVVKLHRYASLSKVAFDSLTHRVFRGELTTEAADEALKEAAIG